MKKIFFMLVCSFFLYGCSSIIESTHFYILSAPTSYTANTSLSNAKTIGILPINLPEYLNTTEIVLRSSNATQIKLSNNHRWAESLDTAFQDVLSQSLNNDLIHENTLALPLRVGRTFEYTLIVDVKMFEGDLNQDASLKAYWFIDNEKGTFLESFFTSTLPVKSTYTDLTLQLSKLIELLAEDISKKFIAKTQN